MELSSRVAAWAFRLATGLPMETSTSDGHFIPKLTALPKQYTESRIMDVEMVFYDSILRSYDASARVQVVRVTVWY